MYGVALMRLANLASLRQIDIAQRLGMHHGPGQPLGARRSPYP